MEPSSPPRSHCLDIQSSAIKQVHLIILVHGMWGNTLEMGYIEQSLRSQIEQGLALFTTISNNSNNNTTKITHIEATETTSTPTPTSTTIQFMTHCATCNAGKTLDGVSAGGKRLADEINGIIDSLYQQRLKQRPGENNKALEPLKISLSIVGNSLGGLYARYAVSEISFSVASSCPSGQIDRASHLVVEPHIFMTTATPHLGKSCGTYLRLPRMVETIIGKVLQPTGEDLFYDAATSDSIIRRMSVEKEFVEPLRQFKKRIAYANAYGTDFQVPTNTAAFLSNTKSVHCVVKKEVQSAMSYSSAVASPPKILLTVQTLRKETIVDDFSDTPDNVIDQMALRLDAMGWTKVFVDVRPTMVNIPTLPILPISQRQLESEDDIPTTIASSELQSLFGNHIIYDNMWSFPMGHRMMIANSKSKEIAEANAPGRPLVDLMCSNLLRDILTLT